MSIRLSLLSLSMLWLIIASQPVFAVQPNEMLADPKLEARARQIGEDLRCLVCQNQSIDDSDADLAHDLRMLVRQRLQAGDNDDQVKRFLVARYGDYVLLTPPFQTNTLALWLGAPILLLIAITVAILFNRRRSISSTNADEPLSADEKRRIANLIETAPPDRKDLP